MILRAIYKGVEYGALYTAIKDKVPIVLLCKDNKIQHIPLVEVTLVHYHDLYSDAFPIKEGVTATYDKKAQTVIYEDGKFLLQSGQTKTEITIDNLDKISSIGIA